MSDFLDDKGEYTITKEVQTSPDPQWPLNVKILNQNWAVVYADSIDDEGECLGRCDHSNRTIYISLDQCLESMREVLLHEIAHAYYGMMAHGMGREHDEDFAKMWAVSILDLLRGNSNLNNIILE